MASATLWIALSMVLMVAVVRSDYNQPPYDSDFYKSLGDLELIANLTTKEDAQKILPAVGTQFDCLGEPSAEVPESVHSLRPGDIKVVSSVGDSITAAFGAKSASIITITTEYRGISWSMGGDETVESVTTVPNLLKKFNPNVHGWSIKTGKSDSSNARLNLAVSGAIAKEVPGQLVRLVERMKADPNVDYENDWKLLTIWIGGNDLCAVCKNNPDNQPDQYIAYIRESLDYLHTVEKVPRLFVNLVQILDVSRLSEVSGIICSIVHFVACSCATTDGAGAREQVRLAALEYQRLTSELVTSGGYDTRQDFTVVLQPFFIDTQVPKKGDGKSDNTYFAPDCFHFSGKGQAACAIALWNNMLEPVGQKRTSWTLGEAPMCPSEAQPFLYTRLNGPALSVADNTHTATPLSTKTTVIAVSAVGCGMLVAAIAAIIIAKKKSKVAVSETTPLVKDASESNV